MVHTLLLPLLLYMDLGGYNAYDYATEHCFATKTESCILAFNRVYHKNAFSDYEVILIKQFFDKTPFTWSIERDDILSATILKKHNFTQYHASFIGMMADITTLPHIEYKKNISVKKVETSDDLTVWLSIVSQIHDHYPLAEHTKAINYLLKKAPHSVVLHLAYYADTPAAISIMVYHQNIVTLHMIATLPAYRQKGLGFAVTHKPLLEAKNKGYQFAALMSSDMAKSLYANLGFKEYTIYDIYCHKPQS